jgi:hypothetical protein
MIVIYDRNIFIKEATGLKGYSQDSATICKMTHNLTIFMIMTHSIITLNSKRCNALCCLMLHFYFHAVIFVLSGDMSSVIMLRVVAPFTKYFKINI